MSHFTFLSYQSSVRAIRNRHMLPWVHNGGRNVKYEPFMASNAGVPKYNYEQSIFNAEKPNLLSYGLAKDY